MTSLDPAERSRKIRKDLIRDGLFHGGEEGTASGGWRVSPDPFPIRPEEAAFLERLGPVLLEFYRAANRLYFESVHGRRPSWVACYLDQGKPDGVVEYGRMNRFKGALPGVIRPDILLTDEGMAISELDSVPGGIGTTAGLSRIYSDLGFPVLGGRDGMVRGFQRMLASLGARETPVIAIVVSDESKDYRSEMAWLAGALNHEGTEAHLLQPEEVRFQEEGLFFEREGKRYPIHLLYRFFELFDLKNIPKADLILYAAKKKKVEVTPPLKAFLEEKLLFALFHHPVLRDYWKGALGEEGYSLLARLFPKTWILDPAEMPDYGVIPDLTMGGRAVARWRDLAACTQKERTFVVKPSGFSELAWGSRGLSVGHDLSSEDWAGVLEHALKSFSRTPYILQSFSKGKAVGTDYLDPATGAMVRMKGRVRLCPYYFVEREGGDSAENAPRVRLGGVLATVCSLEKKAIHGMSDAVMAPVAVQP